MSTNSMGNKIKGFFERIGKRNMIIAGAVVLIAAAVLLNWAFFSAGKAAGGYDYDKGTSGNGHEQESSSSDQNNSSAGVNEYYSSVQVSRQRARDEALEVLQTVVASEQANETVKQEALAEIAAIAAEIEKEANIETLVESKGFTACVAVINGDSASIIVSTANNEELTPAQLAQINEIVYSQTSIKPTGITIIRK